MKITVHPLFFATVIFSALFGGLPTALICLVTALLHESGHIFCAAKMGFACKGIKIMPYGAAAICDLEGISAGDEVKLAIAGPMVNAAVCVALAGLWWFFPETYAYTDTVMFVNLSMPAYPLDGGRVAARALSKIFSKRVANIVLRTAAGVCAAALLVGFFLASYNVTMLIFALFLACSAIEKAPSAELINFSSQGKLRRGIEVKYVLCDKSLNYREAFKKLDERKYLVLQLYDGGVADEITQDELYALAGEHSFYDPVFDDGQIAGRDGADYFSKKERENSSLEELLLTSPETTAPTQDTPSEIASSTAPESER